MDASVMRLPRHTLAVLSALALALSMLALAPAALADQHEPIDREDDGDPNTVPVERFPGENRADTAGLIADHDFDGSADTVLMGRWDDFPDVLAANYLAAQVDAPVLLTHTTHLTSNTDAWLDDLGTDHVVILGGTAAVSLAAEADINAKGITTERIGGVDRYETAALLATGDEDDHERAVGQYNGQNAAVVATGEVFVDALASGGMAFDQDFPVLLTRQAELEDATAEALADLDIGFVFIPGGPAAVSQAVEDAITDMDIEVHRFAGARRTDTAAMIADFTIEEFGFSPEHVNLGRGDLFPDVLTMGPHAGLEMSPLLVTWSPTQLDVTDAEGDERRHTEIWLRENACEIFHMHIAGGTEAVSNPVARQAQEAAEDCPVEPDTNIVFLAEPAAGTFQVNPAGTQFDYRFDVLDADEVTIVLVDPDSVIFDNGFVTFDEDGVAAGFAAMDLATDVTFVEIDGDTDVAGDQIATVTVGVEGEVEFTVQGEADLTTSVVPVVFVGDETDPTFLAIDEDGFPLVDFGVGGEKHFVVEVEVVAALQAALDAADPEVAATVQAVLDAGAVLVALLGLETGDPLFDALVALQAALDADDVTQADIDAITEALAALVSAELQAALDLAAPGDAVTVQAVLDAGALLVAAFGLEAGDPLFDALAALQVALDAEAVVQADLDAVAAALAVLVVSADVN